MTTEIIPGIHQLQIPIPNNPLGHTNIYLLRGTDGYLLIDTGWNSDEALQALKDQLAEIGVAFGDITQIVVTHSHIDHYGLIGKMKELTPAKVSLHHKEQSLLEQRYNADNMQAFIRQTDVWLQLNGAPTDAIQVRWAPLAAIRSFLAPPQPDVILHGGETISTGIFTLQVIATPGHSRGHICLYEPNHKILFSGDHILPVITPNVSLQAQSETNPLGEFMDSLDKVEELAVELVLPAHEQHFTALSQRIEEIRYHHERRSMEILDAIQLEAKTAYEISTEIIWMPEQGGYKFERLATWDRRMAISETLAHLAALNARHKVNKLSQNSVIYYKGL